MNYTAEETKENRQMWVNALRSGKYTQYKGKLTNVDTTAFCCLGVACDISNLGTWIKLDNEKTCVYSTKSENYGHIGELPTEVQEWLGLSTSTGNHSISNLADLNDEGITFTEIADIIESEPEGLLI